MQVLIPATEILRNHNLAAYYFVSRICWATFGAEKRLASGCGNCSCYRAGFGGV